MSFLRRALPNGLIGLSLGRQQRCPFCHDSLHEGQALVACSACRAVYHRECLGEEGYCRTFGCPHAPTPEEISRRERLGRLHERDARRKRRRLALILSGALTSLLFVAWAFHDPPPPPPPPYQAVSMVLEPVTPPQPGQPVEIVGQCFNGAIGVGQVTLFEGRRVWAQTSFSTHRIYMCGRDRTGQVRGEFRLQLTLPPGDHHLRAVVELAGHTAVERLSVHVPHPPQPVGQVSPRLNLPRRTDGGEVLVRGQLLGNGPARVTIHGPQGQRVEWETTAPAPIAAAITLPSLGRHTIRVVVRDQLGGEREATQVVQRVAAR